MPEEEDGKQIEALVHAVSPWCNVMEAYPTVDPDFGTVYHVEAVGKSGVLYKANYGKLSTSILMAAAQAAADGALPCEEWKSVRHFDPPAGLV